jgi:hypothetical protein
MAFLELAVARLPPIESHSRVAEQIRKFLRSEAEPLPAMLDLLAAWRAYEAHVSDVAMLSSVPKLLVICKA